MQRGIDTRQVNEARLSLALDQLIDHKARGGAEFGVSPARLVRGRLVDNARTPPFENNTLDNSDPFHLAGGSAARTVSSSDLTSPTTPATPTDAEAIPPGAAAAKKSPP